MAQRRERHPADLRLARAVRQHAAFESAPLRAAVEQLDPLAVRLRQRVAHVELQLVDDHLAHVRRRRPRDDRQRARVLDLVAVLGAVRPGARRAVAIQPRAAVPLHPEREVVDARDPGDEVRLVLVVAGLLALDGVPGHVRDGVGPRPIRVGGVALLGAEAELHDERLVGVGGVAAVGDALLEDPHIRGAAVARLQLGVVGELDPAPVDVAVGARGVERARGAEVGAVPPGGHGRAPAERVVVGFDAARQGREAGGDAAAEREFSVVDHLVDEVAEGVGEGHAVGVVAERDVVVDVVRVDAAVDRGVGLAGEQPDPSRREHGALGEVEAVHLVLVAPQRPPVEHHVGPAGVGDLHPLAGGVVDRVGVGQELGDDDHPRRGRCGAFAERPQARPVPAIRVAHAAALDRRPVADVPGAGVGGARVVVVAIGVRDALRDRHVGAEVGQRSAVGVDYAAVRVGDLGVSGGGVGRGVVGHPVVQRRDGRVAPRARREVRPVVGAIAPGGRAGHRRERGQPDRDAHRSPGSFAHGSSERPRAESIRSAVTDKLVRWARYSRVFSTLGK